MTPAERISIMIGTAVTIMICSAAYFGFLLWLRHKLNKQAPSEPEYGSKYSEMLANSDGFRHSSLSD